MDVSDVPYRGPGEEPVHRTTMQFMGDDFDSIFLAGMSNNSDARQPEDLDDWPPAVLLDFSYGCAALIQWSPKSFQKFIWEENEKTYYGQGPSASNDENLTGGGEGVDNSTDARTERRLKKQRIREGETEQVSLSEAMDFVVGLWRQTAGSSQSAQPDQETKSVESEAGKQECVRELLAV